MRILVTGSLGTLGRPLVEELRGRGHDVWGCDLSHDGDPYYVRADVADYRQLGWAFNASQPDFVYHLAAEFGRLNGEQYTEQLWRTAAIGTRNVLDLCYEHDARLGFASSSEIYGELERDWLHEDDSKADILHPNEYALSKWTGERQCLAHSQRFGTEVTRLRFFNAYGPGEAFHPFRSVVALFCHKALNGEHAPGLQGLPPDVHAHRRLHPDPGQRLRGAARTLRLQHRRRRLPLGRGAGRDHRPRRSTAGWRST